MSPEITTILIDVDGILTDGKFWVDSNGNVSKGFNTKDVRAIRELISKGFEVYLITASSWAGIDSFAQKTGADVIVERDKLMLRGSFILGKCAFIFDDSWDFRLAELCAERYAPIMDFPVKDAQQIDCRPGNGVIARFITQYIV